MISLRTPLIAATLALAGWAGTAQAQANVTYAAPGTAISVQFGAPPPMRPQGHRHAWVAGHWVKARPGYVYRQPVWSQQGGRWGYAPGRWDRDRDGVPDRHDRRPNNPYRH